MMRTLLFALALLLSGCASRASDGEEKLVSLQLLDRNGFAETISAKDRVSSFGATDFLTPQPYQKVLRVFELPDGGRNFSKITTYHSNGQLWQYLEIVSGRAHGMFREWHPNSELKIEAVVIEGTPDISPSAQTTWLFDGPSHVWDDAGHLIASISYVKGGLEGPSTYYRVDGTIEKEIPYHDDLIDGELRIFGPEGEILERQHYVKGLRHGLSEAFWPSGDLKYHEEYAHDKLLIGTYHALDGTLPLNIQDGDGRQAVFDGESLFSTIEYHGGVPDGEVQLFSPEGSLLSLYHVKNGEKEGEEWGYYPAAAGEVPRPKFYIQWRGDALQGIVKTWYESGLLESQREVSGNKRHGLAFAWFKDGDLMLMEEYDQDLLVKGSYFKKWDRTPTSRVENGKGIATLHDADGHFLRKIPYDKGVPEPEDMR
jgi:antitoxin component YwqK of YwqJK toxin-antitoxin module